MSELRFGKVSSIDYTAGMISVYYPDKSNCVTGKLPVLANGEYNMPAIGDEVAVLHMADDLSDGVVLGKVWNTRNNPKECASGIFYKELKDNKAFIKYDAKTGKLTVKAPIVEIVEDDK